MDSGRPYYGHGGGGRGRGRGGRGGRSYRGGGRRGGGGGGYRGGGGGGGHRHHSQPYRGGHHRGGNNNNRGNRFGGQPQIDPETALLRQIASFVSRVGEFQNLKTDENSNNDNNNSSSSADRQLRSVEFTAASNINDLLPILCAPDKLELLLRYNPEASKMEDKVGKLAHLVISCVGSLPMQTPCYAALTLAVHAQVKGNAPYEGFATRCLQYVMLQIAKELDTTFLTTSTSETTARSICRCKLYLRYLCILANMGIVSAYEGEATVDPNQMTVLGFLSVLVDAATAALEQSPNNSAVAHTLALLVLSCIPYVIEIQSIPQDVVEQKILQPLEALMSKYKSTFIPGFGATALLLKEAQIEEGDEQDEDDDDDDDDDEEEEEDGTSGQVCDSLQDLLRATKYWRKEGQASRFALPVDAPWNGLFLKTIPNPDSGEEVESRPITYEEQPIFLRFPQECQVLNLLLGGNGANTSLKLQYFHLEGAVFGRLPIFGSPPDPEHDDDDDDDEEDMEDGSVKNQELDCFQAMSLLDRYFVAETLRDCLLSHESHVNPTGLQFGNAKSAAEEILRVSHVFRENGESSSSLGFEYAILETIFGLLAQCNEFSSLRHVYLSRVLLELVRLEPSKVTKALMVAVTNLFQDYLPALVPRARNNFSSWFAFHLTNTDYQWPSGYWQLWEPYAKSEQRSSRGEFVRHALHVMAGYTCDPSPIAKQLFGNGIAPSLGNELLGRSCVPLPEPLAVWLETEVNRRIWENQEDPGLLLEYMLGDEVGSAIRAVEAGFVRVDSLLRVVLEPARQLHDGTKLALEKAMTGTDVNEDDMEEDSTFLKDVFVLVTDATKKYTPTFLRLLEKDSEAAGGDTQTAMVQGRAYLLRLAESLLSWNVDLLEAVVVTLLENKIVDSTSIMKWVLRDVGDSLVASVSLSWVRWATIGARENLILAISDASAGGIMTIDDGSASQSTLARQLATSLGQILKYTIQRVCTIISMTQTDDKKMHPVHVDLVEGTKTFIFSCKQLFLNALLQPSELREGMLASELENIIASSEISKESLTSACSSSDTPATTALQVLKKSLENM